MKHFSTHLKTFAAVCTLVTALGATAQADVVAVSITTNLLETDNDGKGYSLGYEFTATANMTVTQLGYFVAPSLFGPPLVEQHNVGIYTTGWYAPRLDKRGPRR